MARAEFPRSVRVAVIKRATRESVVYCEKCGLPAKKFQVDHIDPDGLTGKPVIENAMLICEPCFLAKNAADAEAIARAKRVEAKHTRAIMPGAARIVSAPMPTTARAAKRQSKPPVIRQWSPYRDLP